MPSPAILKVALHKEVRVKDDRNLENMFNITSQTLAN